jgi:hypothetical protein
MYKERGIWYVRRGTQAFLLDTLRYEWIDKNHLHIDTLLYTVDMWCESREEFLDKLINVFYCNDPLYEINKSPVTSHALTERDREATKARIISVLCHWLAHDLDRDLDQKLLRRLIVFSDVLLSGTGGDRHHGKKLMSACLDLNNPPVSDNATAQPKFVKKTLRKHSTVVIDGEINMNQYKYIDFDIQQFAEHLTASKFIIIYSLFFEF